MIQKLRLEKWLTINLKRGVGQFSTLKFDPKYYDLFHLSWFNDLISVAKWFTIKFIRGCQFSTLKFDPHIYRLTLLIVIETGKMA